MSVALWIIGLIASLIVGALAFWICALISRDPEGRGGHYAFYLFLVVIFAGVLAILCLLKLATLAVA